MKIIKEFIANSRHLVRLTSYIDDNGEKLYEVYTEIGNSNGLQTCTSYNDALQKFEKEVRHFKKAL